MKDHPLFSENLVNYLVNQYLDEFIPDLLIEALGEIGRMVCMSRIEACRYREVFWCMCEDYKGRLPRLA